MEQSKIDVGDRLLILGVNVIKINLNQKFFENSHTHTYTLVYVLHKHIRVHAYINVELT